MASRKRKVNSLFPDAGRPLASGILTFLLTDIVDSTRLWEEEPDAMCLALNTHDGLIRDSILSHHGHVFRTAGDSFYAAFSSPVAAIEAAVEIQLALSKKDFSPVNELKSRMAIVTGPVEARDDNYYGPGINRAARLLSLAYGNQILVSSAAADLARNALTPHIAFFDLGTHRLRGIEGKEQIYQLVAPELASAFPPLRSMDAKLHNLPEPVTSFVGREKELEELGGRIRRYRIVTVAGPAGTGKTRIAVQTGIAHVDTCSDGVWFVELASLEEASLVAEALCNILDIAIQGSRTALENAIGFLRHKQSMIIFDNCEHLIEAVSEVADALAANCPSVSIICTSRETLSIDGESVFQLPSFLTPPNTQISAYEALEYPAVRLFVDRANAAIDGFKLDDESTRHVIDICRRVEGIPLAIELAVPRLRMMSLPAIADHLREDFRLLDRVGRSRLKHHRTLQALYDWSFKLLDDAEKAVLVRLSVFQGGWTLDSAEAVVTDDGLPRENVFDHLSSLVEKSLVSADTTREEPRYKLLEPTRQYAYSKLKESRDAGRRKRLAEYMARFYLRSFTQWPTMATEDWLDRFQPDLDNLRASLEWSFGPEGNIAIGLELAGNSVRIWDELALLHERERWFTLALDNTSEEISPAVAGRLFLGKTAVSAHGDQSGLETALKAAELFRKVGDSLGTGEALTKAGSALLTPTTTGKSDEYLQKAFEVLEDLGPTKQLASCLRSMAVSRYFQKEFTEARPLIEHAQAVARAIGDSRGQVNAEIAYQELCFAEGKVDEAITHVRRTLESIRHNRRQLTLCLGNLASYLMATGREADAKIVAFKSLYEARALGWEAAIVRSIEHLALISAMAGEAERAAGLLGFTEAFYSKGTASRELTELATYSRLVSAIDQRIRKREQNRLFALGATWTEEFAIEEAIKT